MFGIWRTVLALCVICAHLLQIPTIGQGAVICFFVLSGYLITMIMAENYGHSPRGILRFSANRALRLYPLYWLAALISLAMIVHWGVWMRRYHWAMFQPHGLEEWAQNATMLFLSGIDLIRVPPRLVPPAWALTVELFFYAAIAVGAARTSKRAAFGALIGLAYVVIALSGVVPGIVVYGTVMSGLFPCAIGAAAYRFRQQLGAYLDLCFGR